VVKTSQRLEMSFGHDVINGFSYSFSKALLEKLKQLKKEGRIFQEDTPCKKIEKNLPIRITTIAETVIYYLTSQMNLSCDSSPIRPSKIEELIKVSKEFLAIFEKEQEKQE